MVRAHRLSRPESLEQRLVLSGTPPAVSAVNVSSTQWDSAFVDYLENNNLGDGGYAIPVGSANQLAPLTWSNVDQIRITFSEDVDIQASDLSVSGVNTTAYAFSNFAYDDQTYEAVWTLSTALDKEAILIDLDADGLDPVVDTDDNALDGEWTDGSSTFDSGNGTAGGDFEFRLNVLPGDMNASNVVSVVDFFQVYMLNGKDTQDVGYDATRDVNGSGNIDSTDYMDIYFGMIGDSLPTGDPAGTNNDAPTTQGFTGVTVNEDAADQVLSLWDAFDDAEDADDDLTYSIVSNSNSGLFDNTAIDGVLGELTLDLAANANGVADLVIRATDSNGLFVDTTLHVDVASVNDAPVISDFDASLDFGNIWVITGKVTDVDNDPEGWTITFDVVLFGHSTTVEADGTFEYIVELDPFVFGTATAQTEDDEGLASNVASTFIGVT